MQPPPYGNPTRILKSKVYRQGLREDLRSWLGIDRKKSSSRFRDNLKLNQGGGGNNSCAQLLFVTISLELKTNKHLESDVTNLAVSAYELVLQQAGF